MRAVPLPPPDPQLVRCVLGYGGTEEMVAASLELASRLANRWNLQLSAHLPGATCSLVYEGISQGREVVLKVPVLGEEQTSGFRAALAYSGDGGVPVLRSHSRSGSLLMPRLRPGTTLEESVLEAADRIRVVSEVWRGLRRAPVRGGRSMRSWLRELLAPAPVLGDLERLLQDLARYLLKTTDQEALLHGDLHPGNVLLHQDRWVAIDPKGVIGDPAAFADAYLRGGLPRISDVASRVQVRRHRIQQFAVESGEPAERIWGWAVVLGAVSAIWESGESQQEALIALRENVEARV